MGTVAVLQARRRFHKNKRFTPRRGLSLLRRIRCQFERLDNGRVIVLWLVDPGRNRPHAQRLGGGRTPPVPPGWPLSPPTGRIGRRARPSNALSTPLRAHAGPPPPPFASSRSA